MYRFTLLACVFALVSVGCSSDGGNGPRSDSNLNIVIPTGVDSQIGGAGQIVPVIPAVRIEDDSGKPVGGRLVHFSIAAGGGTVINPDIPTGLDGIARIDDWKLGIGGGRNALKVTVENGPSVTLVAFGVIRGITTGGDHSCAISANGAAFCWGKNSEFQLGDKTTAERHQPSQVVTTERFIELAAGDQHTCGLTPAGAAWCWGSNQFGQLGINSHISRAIPDTVGGGHVFTRLTAGVGYTCGLDTGGRAWCWGDNGVGQLGDNSTTERLVPSAVAGNLMFTELGAGHGHTCGVTAAGDMECWGSDEYGQVGASGGEEVVLAPVHVASGMHFQALGAGGAHTCGIDQAQNMFCWGLNLAGQLGDSTTTSTRQPVQVVDGQFFLPFSTVIPGELHTCALVAGGAAHCWGLNTFGGLGDNSFVSRVIPTPVFGGHNFTTLSTFAYHTCAITGAGQAFCWGANQQGELGNQSTVNTAVPVAVAGGLIFLGKP